MTIRSNKEVLEYVRDNSKELNDASNNRNKHAIKILNYALSYIKCPSKELLSFMNCEINLYEKEK